MSASVNNSSQWQITRLAGALGAEVTGLALSDLCREEIDTLQDLLCQHQVLFFPDQSPTIDQHVAFGRHFGKLEGHPNLKNAFTEHPELFELAASKGGVADEWHTDLTFKDNPAIMSVLHMVRCPPYGGDTMWTNLNAAYEELSEPMQAFCDSLTALHDALPHNRPDRMAIHPVVRVHPVTGRKSLYVNEHFTRRIVELNSGESDALLRYLTNWVTQPRFTVRYRWHEGTVAMWDNRCTQHFVLNDFEGERIIQRVTVMGDVVDATGGSRWDPWTRPGRLSATSRHDRQLYMYLNQKDRPESDKDQT
jgi:taurine dioxygenase